MLQNSPHLVPWAVIVTRNKPDLMREGKKRVHCIRDLQKAMTNPGFRNHGVNLAILCCVIRRFLCRWKSVIEIHTDFCRWSGNFLLVFTVSSTNCYNCNVFQQFGMSQYNSLNVQSWPKFKCGITLREKIRFLILG